MIPAVNFLKSKIAGVYVLLYVQAHMQCFAFGFGIPAGDMVVVRVLRAIRGSLSFELLLICFTSAAAVTIIAEKRQCT